MGNSTGTLNGAPFHFRGFAIATAVIEDILQQSNASEMVFVGSSAGGLAALIHASRLLSLQPAMRVRAVVDSALFSDYIDLWAPQLSVRCSVQCNFIQCCSR